MLSRWRGGDSRRSPLRHLPRHLPRWAHLALGLTATVLGAVMVVRPLTSLAVLVVLIAAAAAVMGVAKWAEARRTDGYRDDLVGAAWVVLGVVILVWPALSVRGLALGVGVVLVVAGTASVFGAFRSQAGNRLAALLHGAAEVVVGSVALAWPDVTLLVVSVGFGVRVTMFGIAHLWAFVRPTSAVDEHPTAAAAEPTDPVTAGSPRRSGSRSGIAGPAVGLAFALVLAAGSVVAHRAEPGLDDFYNTPAALPEGPGELLRIEPFTRALPPGARGWRILYTTSRDDDRPAVASAIVVAPVAPAAPAAPADADPTAGTDPVASPVIAWAHGTTGVARRCAPSALAEPFESGALFVLDQVIDHGWVLVATDYIGLGSEGGHPYLVGHSEGRAVLDAVRAAHQIDDLTLADQTVVWGHSQGGGAALWAGQLAPSYAPDTGVVGVAALAPASDPIALADNLETMRGGSLFAAYVLVGYAGHYPDVDFDQYVRPTARTVVREMASRCLSEPAVLASVLASLATDMSVFSADLRTGRLGDRLAENTPAGPFAVPLLIGQGAADPLILPDVQADYAARRCADGATVDYRVYSDRGHVEVVAADSPLIPDLMEWTDGRFDGSTETSSCG